MVKFEGTAWDTEDGVIADSALTWVDSDGSLLGTGSMLFITSLSPGWHTITLTATDGDPDGDIVSRRWEVISGPAGMIYTFGCTICASTSFRYSSGESFCLSFLKLGCQ